CRSLRRELVPPQLLTRFRIEREDLVARCGHVKHTADDDRCDFRIGRYAEHAEALARACLVRSSTLTRAGIRWRTLAAFRRWRRQPHGPDLVQPGDVLSVDLRKRRVLGPRWIASVHRPVAIAERSSALRHKHDAKERRCPSCN